MRGIEIDLKRYIEDRKKAVAFLRSDGERYAFPLHRALQKQISVSLDILGVDDKLPFLALALFKDIEFVSPAKAPVLFAAMETLSHRFHAPPLRLCFTSAPFVPFCITLGNDEIFYTFVHRESLQLFSQEQWIALLGREIGHLQNGHIPLITSNLLLDRQDSFLGVAALPLNILLRTWLKTAYITADRAGLIAVRSLEAVLGVIDKTASPSFPKTKELRKQAIALFAETKFYKTLIGEQFSIEVSDCNRRIEDWFNQENKWSGR